MVKKKRKTITIIETKKDYSMGIMFFFVTGLILATFVSLLAGIYGFDITSGIGNFNWTIGLLITFALYHLVVTFAYVGNIERKEHRKELEIEG